MTDEQEIARRIASLIEEARGRINSVTEGHKRWNRVEEAMESICEGAIELLDAVGRYDQADEIQSHMAAHERFDLLLKLFANDDGALAGEAGEAGLARDFVFHRDLLQAMAVVGEEERAHRPGG